MTIIQEYLAQEGVQQRPYPPVPFTEGHRMEIEARVSDEAEAEIVVRSDGSLEIEGVFTVDQLEKIAAIARGGKV